MIASSMAGLLKHSPAPAKEPTEGMILRGITALELSGLAPVQYCGKILCDLGAKVIRIDKPGLLSPQDTLLGNGKLSVSLDLKCTKGIEVFKKLSSTADVLIEPYRPGIMEKLGIGPDVLMKDNKRLIYVRLSGFGQTGIYSKQAGHDINFISLAGVLALLEKPDKGINPPCNIIGDFAAGSLLGSFGIVLALFERERSGHGQVVDVSMMRGSSYLVSWILATKKLLWSQPEGCNLLDGGSYMYNCYKTKDGKWMAVGALEPKFYKEVLVGLELTVDECPYFCDNGFEIFTKKFLEKTQSEWTHIFSKLDACVTPVLSADEAVRARPNDFVRMYGDELPQPLPEPRFSRNPSRPSASLPPPTQGQHTVDTLLSLGYTYQQIQQLASDNVIFFPKESKL